MDQHLINTAFSSFKNLNALIIGDVMIDAYLFGKVDRISPEAPVPVVDVSQKDNRMGGAANVALNVKALGANPILCCAIGTDQAANTFRQLMVDSNLPTQGIVSIDNRPTTVKTRIISSHQQMLRVDEEDNSPHTSAESLLVWKTIQKILNTEKIDVIIFEDYDKGLINQELIQNVVNWANENNIPTTVDPKKRNFSAYKNVTLFKPNLKELKEGLGISIPQINLDALAQAFEQIKLELNCTHALFTLSEHGMYISNGTQNALIPAHVRNISDVSGAGDTVISVASLCLAAGFDAVFSTQMANLAGGLVCEKIGVVPIDGEQLQEEALRLAH